MMKFVILLFLAYASIASAAFTWSNCGSASDIYSVSSVTISPDPPVPGQDLTLTIDGTLSQTVTAGNIELTLRYLGLITIVDDDIDLCSTENPCPIAAGPYTPTITESIPTSVLSGAYTGRAVFTDQNADRLTCLNIRFTI